MIRLVFAVVASAILTGCANQALVHNYEGPVYLRSLQIELAPVRDPDQQLSPAFADITRIAKEAQGVWDGFNNRQRETLLRQLNAFETLLVQGISKKASIPLQSPEEVDIELIYDESGDLVEIVYEYPVLDGAHMNLFVSLYYTERSDFSVGAKEFYANFIELRPEMILQVDGYNERNELFWRNTARYESDKMYKFGNTYVLGVPLERLEDSNVLLFPMANGVLDKLTTTE